MSMLLLIFGGAFSICAITVEIVARRRMTRNEFIDIAMLNSPAMLEIHVN